MIGSILTAAIPVVATIAAALYVLRKIQQYGNMASQRVHDSSMVMEEPGSSVRSGNLKGNQAGSARHRRPHPYQNRKNDSGGSRASKDSHSVSEDVQMRRAFDGIEKECAICFEQLACVELYPCYHSGICINCINKIITDGDRRCPFCRRYIEAYTN